MDNYVLTLEQLENFCSKIFNPMIHKVIELKNRYLDILTEIESHEPTIITNFIPTDYNNRCTLRFIYFLHKFINEYEDNIKENISMQKQIYMYTEKYYNSNSHDIFMFKQFYKYVSNNYVNTKNIINKLFISIFERGNCEPCPVCKLIFYQLKTFSKTQNTKVSFEYLQIMYFISLFIIDNAKKN